MNKKPIYLQSKYSYNPPLFCYYHIFLRCTFWYLQWRYMLSRQIYHHQKTNIPSSMNIYLNTWKYLVHEKYPPEYLSWYLFQGRIHQLIWRRSTKVYLLLHIHSPLAHFWVHYRIILPYWAFNMPTFGTFYRTSQH